MSSAIREVLGDDAPGIFVDMPDDDEIASLASTFYKKCTNTAGMSEDDFIFATHQIFRDADVNTRTASHRHVDGIIRFSDDPETGKQIWGDKNSALGHLIRTAGNSDDLAINFPNSAIFGYWLSSRNADLRKIPRSLASTITGWNAEEVKTSYQKSGGLLAGLGKEGASIEVRQGVLEATGKLATEKNRPSTAGLGSIVGPAPRATGYRCSTITRNATLSVRALRTYLNVSPDVERLIEALAIIGLL